MALTAKQEQYCRSRAQGMNKSDAYRSAYSCGNMKPETINRHAYTLENDDKITTRIEDLTKPIVEKVEINVENILKEIKEIVFADPREIYNEDGTVKPMKDWPDGIAKAVSSFDVVEQAGSDGQSTVLETKKIRFWSKDAAMEKLFKYLGMYERDNEQKKPEAQPTAWELTGVAAEYKAQEKLH